MGYYNIGRRSKSGGKVILRIVWKSHLNAYVLQKFRNDRMKEQDYLSFRLASFCRRSLGGRPHSMEHAQCLGLDSTQDHLPECVLFKKDSFVCAKVREKKKLT